MTRADDEEGLQLLRPLTQEWTNGLPQVEHACPPSMPYADEDQPTDCNKPVPVMPYADSLAYGLATGWMFGRLGCFTAHDHPGIRTSFFLGVKYPEGTGFVTRFDLGLLEAWTADRPHINAWWTQVQQWPSFRRGLHDLISEAEFAEMRTHGPKIRADLEKLLAGLRAS